MSFEIDDNVFPGSAVVYIEARWGNQWATGSGFFVGSNDILTAAHVIYNVSLGGLADEIRIYGSYDPDEGYGPNINWSRVQYFPDFDPDGDGRLISGDFNRPTLAGSEKDIALLTTSSFTASAPFGHFGIDFNFKVSSANVGVAGYPGIYGRNLIYDSGFITSSTVDGVYFNQSLEVNPGNSGGPIFYDYGQGTRAVGIVSTGLGFTEIGAHSYWLYDAIANDRVLGTSGADRFDGDFGKDTMQGFGGDDTLHGGSESDRIFGHGDNDRLFGEGGFDFLDGGSGRDTLKGSSGNDKLNGGKGFDRLDGGIARDTLLGGANNDTLLGGKGDDTLIGGSSDDKLYGGAGRDVLNGQGGDDTLFGGASADKFVFNKNDGKDLVRDFQQGVDKLVIKGASSMADLTLRNSNGDVVIKYQDTTIIIDDDRVGNFGPGDFIF